MEGEAGRGEQPRTNQETQPRQLTTSLLPPQKGCCQSVGGGACLLLIRLRSPVLTYDLCSCVETTLVT